VIKAGLAICMQVPHTYISPHIHAHACKYIYICLSKVTIVVITSQRGAINLNFAPLPEICKIHSQTPGSLFTEAAVQGRVLTLVKWSINTRVMACGYGMDPQGGSHCSAAHAEIQGWGSVGDGENFQRVTHSRKEATKLTERCKLKTLHLSHPHPWIPCSLKQQCRGGGGYWELGQVLHKPKGGALLVM